MTMTNAAPASDCPVRITVTLNMFTSAWESRTVNVFNVT